MRKGDWEFDVNQSALTWHIWWAMFLTMMAILVIAIIGFAIYYIKTNKKFLTVNKIAYFAVFLCIFMIQAFIFAPLLSLPIPFSFDSISVIAVGFMFGPIEGILFGQVADTLRVFIHGWGYGPLPGTMYPMIGLIAGISGLIYQRKKNPSLWTSIVLFQLIMLIILVCSVPAVYGLGKVWDNIIVNNMYGGASAGAITTMSVVGVSIAIMIVIMEGLFFWFLTSENKSQDLFLLLLLTITALADRGMELIIRPFTQYFTGYEHYYYVSLLTRLISSTYLVPTVAITSFAMIKTLVVTMNIK